ncbi:hypothetical protein [Caldithrix abyssi]
MDERNKKGKAVSAERSSFQTLSGKKSSEKEAAVSASNMQKTMPPKTKIYTTDVFAPLSFAKKLGAKTILSLDIDIDKIRYLVVKKIGDNIQVKDWGIQTFPTEITQATRAMQIALENIKSRIYKAGMEVRVTFFSTDLLFKNDVFPRIKNRKELEQAIIFRYKEELKHFKDNEFYLEYYVVDQFEEQGIKKQRLQMVFSPKETVDRFVYIFSHLKFPVSYLVPRPMSLVLAYNKMVDDPKSDLLLNISYDFTQICYLKYGQLIYLRNLGIGSRNLEVTIKQDETRKRNTEEKVDEGKISEPESGESLLKRRLMEKLKDLKVKQNPVLHTFFAEILRSIAFIQGEDKRNFVERILLTGYGIQKESLIPYLKSRLSMPVFVLYPGFIENAQEDAVKYGEYTAAFGAVLADKNSINLIPKDYEEKLILARINRYVNLFCIVGAVTFGYLTFLQYQAITAKEAELSVLEAQYHELNPYEQSYLSLLKLIGDVKKENLELQNKINKDKPPILEMMRLFSNLTPKPIRLTSFVLQPLQAGGNIENENAPEDLPKYVISLAGEIKGDLVTGDVELINFINSLNNLNIFKSINLEQKNKDIQNKKIEFSLTLTF